MKRRRRLKETEAAVKKACAVSDHEFIRQYMGSAWPATWAHPRSNTVYTLSLSQPARTSEADLESCFALVEETSRSDYEASSRGWSPKAKRHEMREPDLRYILVKRQQDPANSPMENTIYGYASLMPTMEDGEPVLYCYEIHLRPDLRGTGLAALLMHLLETVAASIEIIDKVMLTVFTSNQRAVAFYRRCGFDVDETSPQPRRLRNGVVKEPDYAIMSKAIDRTRVVPAGSPISRTAKRPKIDPSRRSESEPTVIEDGQKDTPQTVEPRRRPKSCTQHGFRR